MRFTITGRPYGKKRPRKGKFNVYDPKENREHEEYIRQCFIKDEGMKPEPTDNPVWLNINCYYPVPKGTPKKVREAMLAGKIFPLMKPDGDNIAKSIMDALNGFYYHDDKQVVLLRVYRQYGETAKTIVDIGRYHA